MNAQSRAWLMVLYKRWLRLREEADQARVHYNLTKQERGCYPSIEEYQRACERDQATWIAARQARDAAEQEHNDLAERLSAELRGHR